MFNQYINLTSSYYLLKMQLSAKILLLLCLLFISTKQETKSIDFKETIHTENVADQLNTTTFKVTVSNSSNYIRIIAKGSGEQSTTNHIISYHKKETNLNEREQLSQSGNGTSIMFLNKEQVGSEFFISIQCDKTPCSYDLTLEKSDYAELNVNDAISYYVTEANKQMKFKFIGTSDRSFINNQSATSFLEIYSIGNLEVSSSLENVTEHFKHNKGAYLIQINNTNEEIEKNETKDFILTVNGKQGDIINIGSYFINDIYSTKEVRSNDRFVFGYLKKNLLSEVCFKTYGSYSLAVVGNLDKPLLTTGNSARSYYYSCVGIPDGTDYDEYVFYMQIYDKTKSESFKPLQPHILGSSFIYAIDRGENHTFFFNLADKNFFNYEVYALKGELETFYIECDNFPLCEINSNSTNTTKKIKNINQFGNLALDGEKLKNISPISQKQYIILNKCKYYYGGDSCVFMNYVYSNNNKITLHKTCNYHKYLLKNSQNEIKFSTFPLYHLELGDNCFSTNNDKYKLEKRD